MDDPRMILGTASQGRRSPKLRLALFTWTTVLAGIWYAWVHDLTVTSLLVFVAGVVIAAPVILSRDIFSPLAIYGALQSLVVINFYEVAVQNGRLRYAPSLSTEQVEHVAALGLLIFIVWSGLLYISYYTASRTYRRGLAKLEAQMTSSGFSAPGGARVRRPVTLALILLMLSTSAFLFAVSHVGGVAAMISAMVNRRETYAGLWYLRQLVQLSGLASLLLLYAGRARLSFVIAAIGTVSVALFGGRAAAVLGVLFPYLVFRHYYWRRLHFISILWALGFAFVFVVLWGELRQYGEIRTANLVSSFYELPLRVARGSATGEILSALVASLTYGSENFRYGVPMLNIFAAPIPRGLWPGKPGIIDESGIVGYSLMGERYWGLPPGPYGWAYFNFGWFGVFIFAIVTGVAVARLHTLLLEARIQPRLNGLKIMAYAVLIRPMFSLTTVSGQISLIWLSFWLVLIRVLGRIAPSGDGTRISDQTRYLPGAKRNQLLANFGIK